MKHVKVLTKKEGPAKATIAVKDLLCKLAGQDSGCKDS